MNTAMRVIPIALALAVGGCINQSKNDKVLQRIEGLQLVNSPGLVFLETGNGQGGIGPKLVSLEIVGELVSTNGSPLPPNLANDIAATIQSELAKDGCVIIGSGRGSGIHYTPASGVSNANVERASVSYSLNGETGEAEVLVIERDYAVIDPRLASNPSAKVVGQLIVALHESR